MADSGPFGIILPVETEEAAVNWDGVGLYISLVFLSTMVAMVNFIGYCER